MKSAELDGVSNYKYTHLNIHIYKLKKANVLVNRLLPNLAQLVSHVEYYHLPRCNILDPKEAINNIVQYK